jgi:hypothetical protein
MRKLQVALAVMLSVLLSCGCDAAVNKDVQVAAGSTDSHGGHTLNGNVHVEHDADVPDGDFAAVNGNIRVDERAQVKSLSTVNGNIVLGAAAHATRIETVNGRVELAADASLAGSARLVNGDVSLAQGAHVGGDIETVSGAIDAHGATIDGNVSNYNGGMLIDHSVVAGNLTVHKSDHVGDEAPPRVVIGADSRVLGKLTFERPVELYVHETAQTGPIQGAEAIRYAGKAPPGS